MGQGQRKVKDDLTELRRSVTMLWVIAFLNLVVGGCYLLDHM
jgi:hypothetical protein